MKEDTRQRSKSTASKPDVRLALIGAPRVGKSAISVRFLTRRFIHEYQRNVENTYRRQLEFGNEVIDYAIRDSSGLKDNYNALLDWATCVAVVYSITDKSSFHTASALLDELNAFFYGGGKGSKRIGKVCIALLANKRDLDHLREIPQEEGKSLAKKHGAGYWEVSASEDYHSTHGPLNSMIVESYLNILTLKNTGKNSVVSAPGSLKGHDDSKQRTRSDMTVMRSPSFESDGDSPTSPFPEWPNDKRKLTNSSKDRKKLELRLNTFENKRVKKISVGKLSLDNFLMSDNNNNTTTESLSLLNENDEAPVRTSSWSRKDKKRSSIRKSSDKKEGVSSSTSQKTLLKSHSYSDLKSWEKEQIIDTPTSKSCEEIKEIDQSDGTSRVGGYGDAAPKSFLSQSKEKQATSSFSKLSTYSTAEPAKSPRSRKERRKTTGLTVPTDLTETESPKSPDSEKVPKFKRGEKKSVRRKISSIFRPPKIVVETQ